MDGNSLLYYDAVVAVSGKAINHGFQRLFDEDKLHDEFKFDVDRKHGKKFNAKIGLPTLSFISDNPYLAKITFDIPEGRYLAGKEWNNETEQLDEISYDLKNKSLAFNVDLKRIRYPHFQDKKFLVEELYLEFTKFKNIDTKYFGLDVGDLIDVGEIVNGLVQALQKEAIFSANDPTTTLEKRLKDKKGAPIVSQSGDRLFLGRVTVPKVRGTEGSLRPTSADFSVTTADRAKDGKDGKSRSELNFLLMMNQRDLPKDKRAGIFNSLWNGSPQKSHDATLVLSDYMLLEGLALPIVKKVHPKGDFTIKRGDDQNPARLRLKKELDQKDIRVNKCEAFINESSQIQIEFIYEKIDKIQIGKVDLSIVEVIIKKGQTCYISWKLNADGDIVLSLDDKTLKDYPPEVKGNFGVNKIEDIVKYIVAPNLEAYYLLIKSGIVDPIILNNFRDRFTVMIGDMHLAIELPGNPVFEFSNPHMQGRTLVVDADFIPLPKLRKAETKPFQIQGFPKIQGFGGDLKGSNPKTKPELIGETIISFRYVNDKEYEGLQAKKMPYYILSREQYWNRLTYFSFTGKSEETNTERYSLRTSKESNKEMEQTVHMEITMKAGLEFKGFSPEVSGSIARTLRIDTSLRNEIEETKDYERTTTYNSSQDPCIVATWTLIDRYTLMRNDEDRSVVGQWEYVHEDYLARDLYPPPATSIGESEDY